MFVVMAVMLGLMAMVGVAIAHAYNYDDSKRLISLTCEDYFVTTLKYDGGARIPYAVHSRAHNDEKYGGLDGEAYIAVQQEGGKALFLNYHSLDGSRASVTAHCKVEAKVCYVVHIAPDATTQPPAVEKVYLRDFDRRPFKRAIEGFCRADVRSSEFETFCSPHEATPDQPKPSAPKRPFIMPQCEACDGD